MKQIVEVRLTIEDGENKGRTLYRDVVAEDGVLPNGMDVFVEDMFESLTDNKEI